MSTVSESNHRIRLALVGAGVIGTMHGAVISEPADQRLVAVVDLHLNGPRSWPPSMAGRRLPHYGCTASR
jgi:hypothetical protein